MATSVLYFSFVFLFIYFIFVSFIYNLIILFCKVLQFKFILVLFIVIIILKIGRLFLILYSFKELSNLIWKCVNVCACVWFVVIVCVCTKIIEEKNIIYLFLFLYYSIDDYSNFMKWMKWTKCIFTSLYTRTRTLHIHFNCGFTLIFLEN